MVGSRLAVTLIALLASAVAPAEAQTTPPSYIGQHFDRFEVQSNGKLANARQLTPGMTNNYVGSAGNAEPLAPIWASKCSRDGQTVRFRRTVELYGRPNDAYFDFWHEIGAKWAGKTPLRTFKATINGTVIRAGKVGKVSPRLVHTDLTAAQLAAVRDGPNIFEVQVEKARSPKGPKRCNTDAANRLAVNFRLFGNIRADLALVEPPPAEYLYYKAASPHRTVFFNLSLRNKGPSSVPPGGMFEATFQSADLVHVMGSGQPDPGTGKVAPLGGPFSSCPVEGAKPRFTIRCALGRMRAGDSGSLTFAARREFSSTAFGEAYSTLGWQVSSMSTPDPVSQNNSRTVQIVWCGDSATRAGCSTAQ